MNFVNYNGKIVKEKDCLVSVNSRGLRFGDGVFETLKSKNGVLFFSEDHYARLQKGLQLLQFKIPAYFSAEKFEAEILALLNKNGHNKLARVRFTAFRKDGGLFDEINPVPEFVIQSWALPVDTGQWNSNGLVLGIYPDVNKCCDLVSNLKHNNFLPYVMAAACAKSNKWNDAIVLNNHGLICDSSIANIFLVKNEVVYTPALNQGCVAGIMRKHLLEQLVLNGIKTVESEISVGDLTNADEVFLSNSIYNIRWVQSIGDKKYGNQFTQNVYSLIHPTFL